MKKKVFCIIGESGSGKSTILNMIMEYSKEHNLGYKKLVYSTTRKKRDNEVDGVDYHFVDSTTPIDEIRKDSIEYRVYFTKDNGTSVYFTRKEDFGDPSDTTPLICAPSPEQTTKFIEFCRKIDAKIYVIKVATSTKERIIHLMERCNDELQAQEALRRINDEQGDFNMHFIRIINSADRYIKIQNNYDYNIDEYLKFIQESING